MVGFIYFFVVCLYLFFVLNVMDMNMWCVCFIFVFVGFGRIWGVVGFKYGKLLCEWVDEWNCCYWNEGDVI